MMIPAFSRPPSVARPGFTIHMAMETDSDPESCQTMSTEPGAGREHDPPLVELPRAPEALSVTAPSIQPTADAPGGQYLGRPHQPETLQASSPPLNLVDINVHDSSPDICPSSFFMTATSPMVELPGPSQSTFNIAPTFTATFRSSVLGKRKERSCVTCQRKYPDCPGAVLRKRCPLFTGHMHGS